MSGLVEYHSSDEEQARTNMDYQPTLPSLPIDFHDIYQVEPRRGDDPVFHQNRRRNTQHTDGLWPCHVYLDIEPTEAEYAVYEQVLERASNGAKKFQSLLTSENNIRRVLHVSLSRPLMLTSDTKDKMCNDLRAVVASSFRLHMDHFSLINNEESTRTFSVVRCKACPALAELSHAIDLVMLKYRLPTFHEDAVHHISIGWRDYKKPINVESIQRINECFQRELQLREHNITRFKVKVGKDIETIYLRGSHVWEK